MAMTQEQLRVVESTGWGVCLASPGSGKTRVVSEKASRLSKTGEPVLVLAFSKKACQELQRRTPKARNVEIRTTHSLCYSIIQKHWQDLSPFFPKISPWPEKCKVLDEEGEFKVLSKISKHRGRAVLACVSKYRSLGLNPKDLRGLWEKGVFMDDVTEETLTLWEEYDLHRLEKGYVTFDDMLTYTYLLLTVPTIANEYSSKYKHILIDEAQDTSRIQWDILKVFMSNANTVLAVGDTNQAIYSWRGADGSILREIQKVNRGVKVFHLSQNFRSDQEIITLANKISPTSMVSPSTRKGKVTITCYSSRKLEVERVVKNTPKGTAILARTHSYLEPFERYCILQKVPYGYSKGIGSFYSRPHVKEVRAILREWQRRKAKKRHTEVSVDLTRFKSDTDLFLHLIQRAKTPCQKEDIEAIYSAVREMGLKRFLSLRSKPSSDPKVILSTGHAAKGLEWDVVCVVGCSQGIIPHKKSKNRKEEKNLFYVMCTRAKKVLNLSFVGANPSVFLPKFKDYPLRVVN